MDVKWSDLEPLYRSFFKPIILQPIPIAQPKVDALCSCLERFTKVFGGVYSGKESKRLFLIAPVLAYVSHLFDDVRLLVEENVDKYRRMGVLSLSSVVAISVLVLSKPKRTTWSKEWLKPSGV